MRVFKLVFAISVFAFGSLVRAEDRAEVYNKLFLQKASPAHVIDLPIRNNPNRTREFKTVLPGVLYRGGGPGGQRPLPTEALQSLCEAGFSLAVYAYRENWNNPGTVSCVNQITGQPNKLEYIAGDANDPEFKQVFLKRVHTVATDRTKGPVFVHCWNGYHASGELSAVALRQFCGYSAEEAGAYWLRHASGFKLISRIAKFTPISSLEVSPEIQKQICQ